MVEFETLKHEELGSQIYRFYKIKVCSGLNDFSLLGDQEYTASLCIHGTSLDDDNLFH